MYDFNYVYGSPLFLPRKWSCFSNGYYDDWFPPGRISRAMTTHRSAGGGRRRITNALYFIANIIILDWLNDWAIFILILITGWWMRWQCGFKLILFTMSMHVKRKKKLSKRIVNMQSNQGWFKTSFTFTFSVSYASFVSTIEHL